jgi:hypothetical protein
MLLTPSSVLPYHFTPLSLQPWTLLEADGTLRQLVAVADAYTVRPHGATTLSNLCP